MEEEEKKEKTEESQAFRTGRKKKYATTEDIEAISQAIDGLGEKIAQVSGIGDRLNTVEDNQAKIVKALRNQPEGAPGQGTGNVLADSVINRVLNPPSFLEKLAQRSIIEDLMFGRAIRRGVINSLGKKVAKDYADGLKEALKSVGESADESEGTPSS